MFIAHAPASYLVSRFFVEKVFSQTFSLRERSTLIIVCVIAGVFPDSDLLYFYLIDGQQHNHHSYFTHLPFFWITCVSFCLLFCVFLKMKKPYIVVMLIMTNLLLHLLLDTMCGGIKWLYPFSDQIFTAVRVPAIHQWWVWNFVLHWTFFIEVFISVVAVLYFYKQRSAGYT